MSASKNAMYFPTACSFFIFVLLSSLPAYGKRGHTKVSMVPKKAALRSAAKRSVVRRPVRQRGLNVRLKALAAARKSGSPVAPIRSQNGYDRDKRKMRSVRPVTNLANELKSKSRLTGELPKIPWAETTRGTLGKTLAIDKNLSIRMEVGYLNELRSLVLTNGRKSKSLMRKGTAMVLDHEHSYSHLAERIVWRGPESRFSILALLHEQGHSKDYSRLSRSQRKSWHNNLVKLVAGTLSEREHRELIGVERSAWAYALKTARSLKREGFDIFKHISVKEISATINSYLKNYYDVR